RHTRFKCDWSSDVCSSDLTSLDGPRPRSLLFSTITNTTGTTRRTKNIENTNPEASTLASGLHRLERDRIMGVTPTAAAIVVRKIDRKSVVQGKKGDVERRD